MCDILIYGLEKGENRAYMETLLSSNCKTQKDIDTIKKVASEQGFHSFRIAIYNGEPPDFINCLN